MTTKENKDAIVKLRSRLSRLVDDMAIIRTELANFKKAVANDITKLVETSVKMKNDPKLNRG